MINNRTRTIVSTAAGSTLVASVLGLAALGFSSAANAAPADAAAAQAPQVHVGAALGSVESPPGHFVTAGGCPLGYVKIYNFCQRR